MAATGYAPVEVRPFLDRIAEALERGNLPAADALTPRFSTVSFGYDPEQVDELLTRLRAELSTPAASLPDPSAAGGPAPAAEADPAPDAETLDAADRGAAMLTWLTDARFNLIRRHGYDPQSVDDFIDHMSEGVRDGRDVSIDLMEVRFPSATRRGYAPAEVDRLLDDLRALNEGRQPPTATTSSQGTAPEPTRAPRKDQPGRFRRLFG
ncbi:MAG: DivIVA domain-containing protein [Propionibacteriaceae bacterium]|nr:DivIVA domain-containing protein [Propionibacteriaceae bacterium]